MSNLDIKRKLAYFYPKKVQNRKIILLYHSVGNTPWGMNAHQFSEQMDWLVEHCQVLPLSELIQAQPNHKIQVALTFDDGYQSLFQNVMPCLQARKIGAMVYLNTGWISDNESTRKRSEKNLGHYPDEFFLTWNEVTDLHRAGWEIGSHGVNHYNFPLLEDKVAIQELIDSKKHIEEKLSIKCPHFSYPWGRHSEKIKRLVENCEFDYAVGAQHSNIKATSDKYALPRMNIEKGYSFEDFKNIVQGKWDYLGWLHKMRGL